ncbi:serine protease [Candidatus Uabimicrobium sp. HlEnr_7]|uniref:S1 family peptidase n=1 Tax=Candidatus Uabimicrobium helgolandensis TaxID=3095367 RepID=UPI003558272C
MKFLFILFLFLTCCSQLIHVKTNSGTIGREDRKIEKYLLKTISKALTTPTKQLISQLHHTTCKLTLPPTRSKKMKASEVYKNYKESVVIICGRYLCDNCDRWHISTSSGFILSKSGACVTSYHVIADLGIESFIVMTANKKCYDISRVLAADKDNDFAIVQLKGKNFPTPIPLGKPVIGNNIYVISHPQSRYYSMTSGIVSRFFTPEKRKTQTPYVTITADYATGSSGGPVFDEYGNVIGIVSYTQSAYTGKNDLQMVFKNITNAVAIRRVIFNE